MILVIAGERQISGMPGLACTSSSSSFSIECLVRQNLADSYRHSEYEVEFTEKKT